MKLKAMLAIVAALMGSAALANYIEINTAEAFMELEEEYFHSDSTVVLTSDLDFTGLTTYSPLGTLARPFCGTFDGQGHSIKNLQLKTEQFKYIGLFGIVEDATLTNFTIESNCHFMSDASDIVTIGSVVAFSERGFKISHVINNAAIVYNGTSKLIHVGGLVGTVHSYGNNPGSIIIFQCHNFGTIQSTAGHTGGIVGYACLNGTNSLVDIEQSSNDGAIQYTGNHTLAGVGGIIGRLSVLKESVKSYVMHCLNHANILIHAPEDYMTIAAGGIIGAGDFSASIAFSVKSCINEGRLYAKTPVIMGGIAGYMYSHHEKVYAYVRNCVNRGSVLLDYEDADDSSNNYLGGIIGYAYTTRPSAAVGDGHIFILNCLNHGDLASRYELAYVGGITGRLFPYGVNSTLVVNCLSEGYIVPALPAIKLYNYGGISGFALFSSGVTGHLILYSYYNEQNAESVPGISESMVSQVSSYDSKTHVFNSKITIEGKEYFDTVSALNALTSYDTEDESFVKWLIFDLETNGGFYFPLVPEIMHLEYISPPTPEKLGGAFRGWFTDIELTQPLNVTALSPGIHSLFAKWEMFSYSISFYDTSKKLISKETGECGTPVTFPTVKAPKGKVAQWLYENGRVFTSKNFVDADTNLYLTWADKSAAGDLMAPSFVLCSLITLLISLFI